MLFLAIASNGRSGDSSWQKEVTKIPPGNFPSLPSMRMHFIFGWSNVVRAAKADATIVRKNEKYRAIVSGKTEGWARTLWPLDAQHSATIQALSLHPDYMAQVEVYRNRTIETQVRYNAFGLERLRKVSTSKKPAKWKRINFVPIYDAVGGILYVRSQLLKVGDKIGVVCFPGDSPYLVVARVEKREMIYCMGKDWPALRLSLDIRKLEVKDKTPNTAVNYAKFKSGTVWVSDDDLRIPLRAEVNVFVGFVYGELSSFEKL